MEATDRVAEQKKMAVTLGNRGCDLRRMPNRVTRNLLHALEDSLQPLHTTAADVHLAQKQIGENPH
jgi:hypothetical protein